VECPCGHNNGITITYNMFLPVIEDESGIPLFDTEELVDVGVYLVADFLTGLQTHHHKLAVFAGE
jgi:hypothetical protein